jgi:hypothetical protein
MAVDAYFDTFNAFDTCRRLVTLEAPGQCRMHDLRPECLLGMLLMYDSFSSATKGDIATRVS